MTKVSGGGNRECYCEFTGGGDIHVRKQGQGSTMSIVNVGNVATSPSSSTGFGHCGKKVDNEEVHSFSSSGVHFVYKTHQLLTH